MPSADYILAARHTSMAIGALTCLCVYLIVTLLSNWIGGVIAGLFMGVHPLSVLPLHARGLGRGLHIPRRDVCARRDLVSAAAVWGRAILLGIVLGIGTSLKLSPIFVAIGLAAIGVGILVGPQLARIPAGSAGSGTGWERTNGRFADWGGC